MEFLKKKKDFEKVYKKGKFLKGNFFHFKILENNLNITRFGLVVSNRISNKATIRNKLKRRMREIVRKLEKPGFDIVIIAQKKALDTDFWGLKKEIEQIILK